MRHVGDVHLKMPAAGAALDVNGVVEIARGLAVNRDDRQVAKIAPRVALRVGRPAAPRAAPPPAPLRESDVRQVVLADEDLDVDAEFARAAQHLDHAARRGHASARETA